MPHEQLQRGRLHLRRPARAKRASQVVGAGELDGLFLAALVDVDLDPGPLPDGANNAARVLTRSLAPGSLAQVEHGPRAFAVWRPLQPLRKVGRHRQQAVTVAFLGLGVDSEAREFAGQVDHEGGVPVPGQGERFLEPQAAEPQTA